jgi:hypothetical protein
MWGLAERTLLVATVVATLAVGGCGDDKIVQSGVGPGTAHGGGRGAWSASWSEPAMPALTVAGGDAFNDAGQATSGGNIHVVAAGAITLPSTGTGAPALPSVPGDAMAVSGDMLGADLTVSGSILIDGQVNSGGTDAVRTINASGDIFITGKLVGAALGGQRQGLALVAGGAIVVSGSVEAGGVQPGEAGGAISFSAATVAITGVVSSSGADGRTEGPAAGGAQIAARELFYLAPSARLRLRGGAAWAGGSGGPAGTLIIDGPGAVQIAGTVDARGGMVAASGPSGAHGGAAGAILIGETTRPASVEIAGAVLASGGTGRALGGGGGTINLEPKLGALTIGGTLDVSGGASEAQAGVGGSVSAPVGTGAGTNGINGGDILLTGRIIGNGGAISAGGVGNGGEAGRVTLDAHSLLGTLTVAAEGTITVDGGGSRGAAVAGGGGHVTLLVQNGDMTVAGKLSGKGGAGDDDVGTGGLGGQFNIFSDDNHDGDGGNLLLDTTAVIDASGGPGAVGGSARNDGRQGVVAAFPEDRELIAVLVNCDGIHGNSRNWLQNLGWIITRGGAHNGNGGDIAYHGITPDRNPKPPSGNIDTAADGSGVAGDFRGE